MPIIDVFLGDPRKLELTDTTRVTFSEIKTALISSTLLAHPNPFATISLAVDASDYAIGAVLQRFVSDTWEPLGFFCSTS